MSDPYRLARFETAQDQRETYSKAVIELRAGDKATHWMWFIFPQIAGLGHSPTSRTYAISSLPEAEAYLKHPVLGPRLLECAHILTQLSGRTAEEIFGPTDAIKLRSSMTLFARASPDNSLFDQVLRQYFAGARDDVTEQRIAACGADRAGSR